MPDVPESDFIGALSELWFSVSYIAYHLVYVKVYLQTDALQRHVEVMRKEEQALRDMAQEDLIVCRAHLAALFWQLDHFFEALRAAIKRGQGEHRNLKYFWTYEKQLEKYEQEPIRKEISAYPSMGHGTPGIIGCRWEGDKFLHHFLPTIDGFPKKESVDINTDLQRYFEFVANVWLSFAPGYLKSEFSLSFEFPVTVPNSFIGELPQELAGVPRFRVRLEAYQKNP